MKNKILIILIFMSTILYAQPQCEFPPQFGVKNFSFETHGYTPPEYALKDDTFGLVDLDKFGNDATRNAITSSDFPFEALNIIAACGNSDAMYGASLVYDDKKVKEYWLEQAEIASYRASIFEDEQDKYLIEEKKYKKEANTTSKKYKSIKIYWLKRAIKMGNIKAIVTYYMYIEKDEQKRNELIAKALYKIYRTNKNKFLQDMAFSELYYNKEYQNILGIDLSSYTNIKYLSLHTKVFDTGHWRNFHELYQVGIANDDLEFFKKESIAGVSKASLELADYYSWRGYKKSLKYFDLYKKQEHKLSVKLYPYKAKYYDKQNKTNAYIYSKDTLINTIWNDLDEYQKKYSYKLDKKIKAEDKKLNEIKKLNSFYEKESTELFSMDIQQLVKLQKREKLNLIQSQSTNISKNDEKFIFKVMHHIAQWKKSNKAFIKSRNRREKKMKELYAQLSNRSKNIVINISKKLIKNNPKFYTTKSKDKHFKTKETMTRVQSLVLNLLETFVSIENNEYDRPTIVKKVKKFNKPEYNIKYTKNVMLLARKIDTLAFSNSNSYSSSLQNKYILFKKNKPKIQKAVVYWLEYIIKHKNKLRNKYTNKAYYRLAKAYDKKLHLNKLEGLNQNKEKIFELLGKITAYSEKSFSRYLLNNYHSKKYNDFKTFLNKAIVYSHKNKVDIMNYFNYEKFETWESLKGTSDLSYDNIYKKNKGYRPIEKGLEYYKKMIDKEKRVQKTEHIGHL